MSLVGFKAQNHKQQVGTRGALDKVDDRRTPRDLWEPLNARFQFTLDAAASHDNALCDDYYTVADDSLIREWRGSVWCNPPYSDCGAWVKKAWVSHAFGCETIVMLLPANRTEQGWWQDLVEPHRDAPGGPLTVEFLRGRLRFDTPDRPYTDPRGNRPPFGCCLLIWVRGAGRA